MTENDTTYAAFAVICLLLLLTQPFMPAFCEWLWGSDFAALSISANYTSDIDQLPGACMPTYRLGLG